MQYVDGDVNIEFLKTKASVGAQQVDKIDGKLIVHSKDTELLIKP